MLLLKDRCVLLTAASAVALSATAAQAQDSDQREGIVVVGTRASLESAERFKRNADVLVDNIDADDIGDLPDASIADSLVRIPGISANDSVDGFNNVSVRGLGPDLTITTYNGRILPTLSPFSRRMRLGDLPSEGIQRAYVQKTADAGTIEGGLAGTLGLQSIHPLEAGRKRRGFAVVLRGIRDDNSGEANGVYGIKPYGFRGEATYIDRLADNLGVALTYAYLKRSNMTPNVHVGNYQTNTGAREDVDGDGAADAYPGNAGIDIGYNTQKRHSLLGTVQWDPVPELRVTADGFYVRGKGADGPIRFFAVGIAAQTMPVPSASTVTNGAVSSLNGEVQRYRMLLNGGAPHNDQVQGGLNFAFDNGGPISFDVDLSYGRATVAGKSYQANVENAGVSPAAQQTPFGFDFRDPFDISMVFEPLAPEDYSLNKIIVSNGARTDTLKALRADFTYDAYGSFLKSIDFGLRASMREKTNTPDQTEYAFGGPKVRPGLDSSYLAADSNPFAVIGERMGGPGAVSFPLFDLDKLLAFRDSPDATLLAHEDNDVSGRAIVGEDTYALYTQANLKSGALTGNIGVRYFITDETVVGYVGTTEANAVRQRAAHSYGFLLPSLNLRYEITEPLILRFAASKTVSRPVYGKLKIGSAVDLTELEDGTIPTINRGNPDLKPFTSKNIDLTMEWYPDSSTSFAIQGYYKWVSNFIADYSTQENVVLPDGSTTLATINTSINDPEVRRFRGIEVLARRELDFLPGFLRFFGVQGSFTHNITDAHDTFTSIDGEQVEVTPNNFTRDILNAQLYYSRKGFDMHLAYRYFDRFSRADDGVYETKPGGQFDLTASLEVVRNIRLMGSVRNLTQAKDFRYYSDPRNPSSHSLLQRFLYAGRTFSLGIRAKL